MKARAIGHRHSSRLVALAALAFLLCAAPCGAAVIAYEGFDYNEAVGTDLYGLNGGVGWGTNTWTTAIVATNITGKLAAGLTFSDYPVSGKAGVITMAGPYGVLIGASRQFGSAVKAGDALWMSFLFMRNTKGLVAWGSNTVRIGTAPIGGTVQLDIQTRAGSDHDTSHGYPAPSGLDGALSSLWPNTSEITYLCVAEVTNIGGDGTETLWILSAANYDAIKAGGITRAKLVANNIATATKPCSNITLDTTKYLQLGCGAWQSGTTYLTVDEIKLATTLTEVFSPIKGEPAKPPVLPKPFAGDKPVRINCGNGPGFTDSAGNVWLPDQYYVDGAVTDHGNIAVSNTKDAKLYQTERWNVSAYILPFANGYYAVKLHFSEIANTDNFPRAFYVSVNGVDLPLVDLSTTDSKVKSAVVKTVEAEVTDGKLTIAFIPEDGNTMIHGIEVIPSRKSDQPKPKPAVRIAKGVPEGKTPANLALHKTVVAAPGVMEPEALVDGNYGTRTVIHEGGGSISASARQRPWAEPS